MKKKAPGKRIKNDKYRLLSDFLIEVTSEIKERIESAKSEIELENYVKSLICHRLGCLN